VRHRISLRRARRRDGEEGLALLETAIVAPFLILLVLGIWEFSNGWQSNLTVQTTVRAAARTGSGLGNDRAADYAVLQAVKAGLTDFAAADIKQVIVYKATAANGEPPATCITGGSSAALFCNVYDGTQVNTLTLASFTGDAVTGCTGTSPDRFWCPSGTPGRSVSQASPDYLGVYIRVLSRYQTGFFPGQGITVEKNMVMRIEPKVEP
jgi:Flp pilus assembly protein TadG